MRRSSSPRHKGQLVRATTTLCCMLLQDLGWIRAAWIALCLTWENNRSIVDVSSLTSNTVSDGVGAVCTMVLELLHAFYFTYNTFKKTEMKLTASSLRSKPSDSFRIKCPIVVAAAQLRFRCATLELIKL